MDRDVLMNAFENMSIADRALHLITCLEIFEAAKVIPRQAAAEVKSAALELVITSFEASLAKNGPRKGPKDTNQQAA